jgi:hypothetical protein
VKAVYRTFSVSALVIISMIAGGIARSTKASLVYDNQAAPTNAASTSDATSLVRADDFILPAGTLAVTGVQWTGQYAGGMVHVDDDFTIQFFESEPADDPTPLPPFDMIEEPEDANLAIATFTVANPNRTGSGVFQYSASFAPLALTPGTRYWVSIFNDSSDETAVWLWRSQLTGLMGSATDIAAIRNQADEWGNVIGDRMDYQLLGDTTTIPESRWGIYVLAIMIGLTALAKRYSGGLSQAIGC